MIKHYFSKQFLGFLAVGGTAALLHWLARIVLNQWMGFAMAVFMAYGVGMAVAFVLNSVYVFPKSPKPRWQQARDFVLVNLAFLPVVWAASLGLNQLLHHWGLGGVYAPALAHGVAVAIPTLATFLIYKFFTFKDSQYGR